MTEFRTDEIFQTLKGLLRVIDNEDKRRQIESYIDAAQLPVERAVFDLLSHFAEAVDGQISAHYRVNLAYRPGVLDLEVKPASQDDAAAADWQTAGEGEVEKITLRIPAELKDLATEAAARAGLSVNAWYVRMVARAVRNAGPAEESERRHGRHRAGRGPGGRLSGWVGPE